ncbi:unnamed protein product [Effrenium voratum]|uniref:Uncharacterized protein n=1 Tax=Effrenium voratum TaxID=2562239 RepID=A0AA36HSY6_9DINO|nr:unnamed protein product [Effrenium voratum]
MSLASVGSLVIGTLLGFLFFAIAGLGKLLPQHPMHAVLRSTFDKAAGPFFGLPSTLLRLVIGLAELSAGLVFMAVPWGVNGLPADKKAPAEALLLCAILGMLAIMTGALLFNWIAERQLQKLTPYIVFITLLILFFRIQVQTTDFERLPEEWMQFMYYFPAFCGVGMVVSLLWAYKFGITMEELHQRMEEIHQMREQLLEK